MFNANNIEVKTTTILPRIEMIVKLCVNFIDLL